MASKQQPLDKKSKQSENAEEKRQEVAQCSSSKTPPKNEKQKKTKKSKKPKKPRTPLTLTQIKEGFIDDLHMDEVLWAAYNRGRAQCIFQYTGEEVKY